MSYIEMTGKIFGFWTVISKQPKTNPKRGDALWLCKCRCGNEKILQGRHLRRNKSKSCGCWSTFDNGFERALIEKTIKREEGCIEWLSARDKDGYARYGEKLKRVTRLLYEKNKGVIPKGMVICHSCDHSWCVNLAHLWLGTVKQNNDDKVRKGRIPNGIEHHRAKITEQDVREIRKLHSEGVFQEVIAKKFGLGQSTVSTIIRRTGWKHVL